MKHGLTPGTAQRAAQTLFIILDFAGTFLFGIEGALSGSPCISIYSAPWSSRSALHSAAV